MCPNQKSTTTNYPTRCTVALETLKSAALSSGHFFTLKNERSITARSFNNELSVLAWLTFYENLLIDVDWARNKSLDTVAGNMTYTFYVKTRAFEKECKDKNCSLIDPGIPNLKITKCDSACCKTDLCNDGARVSMVSGFTLFTCALVALTRWAVSKD